MGDRNSYRLSLANKVRTTRQARGQTIEQFAQSAGIGAQTVKQIEAGKTGCNVTTLIQLSKELGIATDELLGLSCDEKNIQLSSIFASLTDDHKKLVHAIVFLIQNAEKINNDLLL